jgi:hypothetical protein
MPAAKLTPAFQDFGEVELGSGGGAVHSFKLSNSGSASLTVSAISVAGADADQFSVTGTESCTDAPLEPNASCEFSAVFQPSTAGELNARVEVVSNAASSPDTASLSGIATGASTSGSPTLPAAAAAIGVDNAFTIGRPILNKRKGTARLPVTLPGAGTLIATGSGVSTVNISSAETVKLLVKARGRKLRTLGLAGKVPLRLALTFVPRGGGPSTQTTTVRLRKTR